MACVIVCGCYYSLMHVICLNYDHQKPILGFMVECLSVFQLLYRKLLYDEYLY